MTENVQLLVSAVLLVSLRPHTHKHLFFLKSSWRYTSLQVLGKGVGSRLVVRVLGLLQAGVDSFASCTEMNEACLCYRGARGDVSMRMWGVFETFERARFDRGAVLGDQLYLLSTHDGLRLHGYNLHQNCNIISGFKVSLPNSFIHNTGTWPIWPPQ